VIIPMQSGGPPAPTRPALPRRIKVGIGATVVTLVILVYPGQMALPASLLTPLVPRVTGCANMGMAVVVVALFGVAYVISGVLVGLGIVAITLTARRNRIGLVGAVLINAITISLLLTAAVPFAPAFAITPGLDPAVLGLFELLGVCALVPAAAIVALLSPTVFRSWWRSGRPFVATFAAVGLLLIPGAAGVVVLGSQIAGMSAPQPTTNSTGSTRATC
jgi:hypothetical protein